MSETNETKKKSGGSAILLFLLTIGGLWLWKQKRDRLATEANVDTILDYSGGGGGGGGGYDEYYQDDVIVDIGGDDGSSDTGNGGNGSGNGSGTTITPIKQATTARTSDPEWQAQKARINMNLLPSYQKKQIEKGAVTKNTLKSIADYQAVKAGTMSAFDYANDPNMPEEMRAGIEYSSTAYQGSATTVRNRALSYYAGIAGAHRGSMSAAERTAWDSTNEKAALKAYANAAGSGWQADTARELAGKLSGGTTTATVSTTAQKQAEAARIAANKAARTSVTSNTKTTTSQGTSGLGLGASKGSAQPGKGSTSSGKNSTGKTSTAKGTSGAGKGAAKKA